MSDTDDWFDVEQIGPDAWRIGEAAVFNDYLVAGEDRAVLLDASVGAADLRAVVEDLVDVPVVNLLTHTHWDHMGAAHQFDDVRVHERELPPDGEVRVDYVAEEFNFGPDDWIAARREQDLGFPDGFDPDDYEIPPAPATAIEAGEVLDLGGRELELVHLPGHAPGQLGALDREAGVVYGGDVVHLDYDLYVHFDGCDVREYVDAFERLLDLRAEGAFDTLYTAHNRPLSGDELDLLEAFHEGLQGIVADELPYDDEREDAGRVYEIAGNEVLTRADPV